MKTSVVTLAAFVYMLAVPGQAQQAAISQPNQAQQQPCGSTAAPNTAGLRTPGALSDPNSRLGKIINKYSPIDPTKLPSPKAPAPCPSAAPPAQVPSQTARLPAGVISTWLCNPIVTSSDASHTVTFITPDELTSAEPIQPNAFEADGAKADPKAVVSCANLRRDPKNNKVFLAQ